MDETNDQPLTVPAVPEKKPARTVAQRQRKFKLKARRERRRLDVLVTHTTSWKIGELAEILGMGHGEAIDTAIASFFNEKMADPEFRARYDERAEKTK
jgi:hypothetical protein